MLLMGPMAAIQIVAQPIAAAWAPNRGVKRPLYAEAEGAQRWAIFKTCPSWRPLVL